MACRSAWEQLTEPVRAPSGDPLTSNTLSDDDCTLCMQEGGCH